MPFKFFSIYPQLPYAVKGPNLESHMLQLVIMTVSFLQSGVILESLLLLHAFTLFRIISQLFCRMFLTFGLCNLLSIRALSFIYSVCYFFFIVFFFKFFFKHLMIFNSWLVFRFLFKHSSV